jgi:hypothetical protein
MLQQLEDLFSITAWKSADGWTVCIQRYAGDAVKQVTRKTLADAISACVDMHRLPPLPYRNV